MTYSKYVHASAQATVRNTHTVKKTGLLPQRRQTQVSPLLAKHQYSIEHGFSQPTRRRSLHAWIVAISLFTALPLGWWLSTSNASLYEPEPTALISPQPSLIDVTPVTPLASIAAPTTATKTPEPVVAEPESNPDWIEERIQAGDTLSSIFERHRLSRAHMHAILALPEHRLKFRQMRPGQYLTIHSDENGQVNELMLELSFDEELYVSRETGGFKAKVQTRLITEHVVTTRGVVESSLYSAAQKNGMPSQLILDMVKIFRWDIDFAQNIQAGDKFSVVYREERNDTGQRRAGEILAVEFINQGHEYRAVRYEDSTGFVSYYTPEGNSLRKAFLRTPVEYGTLTSTFGYRRHPILNRIRQHKGVDYAAPTGTPIMASGDAVIKTMQRQRGYGNVVILSHDDHYETLYAHMSGFASGLKEGQRVRQGTIIGYVGQSGLATGPHLHYEFHIDGVHHDPLTVKLPNSMPLPKEERTAFKKQTQPLMAQLAGETPEVAEQETPETEASKATAIPPVSALQKEAQIKQQLVASRNH